jgi:ferric-chelate reductase (NADPH)
MGQAACDAVLSAADGFLWFAGQKGLAAQVRKTWKEHGGAAERSYISAFW